MTNLNFSELYAKHYPEVVNYINWKFPNSNFAEDIAQEVFVKAYRFLNTYNPEKSEFPTWLRNVMNSCIIDFHRTNQYGKNCINVSEYESDDEKPTYDFIDNSASADKHLHNQQLSNKISKAFSTLKEGRERLIAHLYFIDEFEYNEIVEMTAYPMGTVKGMINRIRTKLQSELAQCSVA